MLILLFYSPNLNPIEVFWANFNHFRTGSLPFVSA
ncbi:hypothetical protein [Candidatus Protochlamydia amoebophila]